MPRWPVMAATCPRGYAVKDAAARQAVHRGPRRGAGEPPGAPPPGSG